MNVLTEVREPVLRDRGGRARNGVGILVSADLEKELLPPLVERGAGGGGGEVSERPTFDIFIDEVLTDS